MKIKVTPNLIKNLRDILDGKTIAYSALPKGLAESLLQEGLLSPVVHGSRKSLRTNNPEALKSALPAYHEALSDLDYAESLIGAHTRADQAALSGNSKLHGERSCPGFLVNAYDKIDCRLNGEPFTVSPAVGSAIYIADWQNFTLPEDILIVGVENMENFLRIREQRKLVESFMANGERGVLFVARYALSSDLMKWLGSISNRYLHFGDFDLAGISIFLTQFRPYVGDRGTYLIPEDLEGRIAQGSRERYDAQYAKYYTMTTDNPQLQSLITLIHRHRRCYDQEGYIIGK